MAQFDPSKGFDSTNSEYELQQQALEQKRKMIAALTKPQPVVAVNDSQRVAQGVAQLGQALIGAYTGQQSQRQSQDIEGQRRQALAAELQGYMTKSQGGQTDVLNNQQASALMNNDVAPQPREVAADPKAAMVQALTSQHPEMRAIGGQQMMQQMTPQKPTDHVMPNGDLLRVQPDGTMKNLGNFGKQQERWEPVTVPGPDGRPIAAQKSSLTGKIDVIDKGVKVNNTVNTGDKALDNAFGKDTGEAAVAAMKSTREEAMVADKMVQEGLKMYSIAQSPDFVAGAGANQAQTMNAWATKLGITGPNAAATAQAAIQSGAQRTLDAVRQTKGSSSDKDIKFLEDVVAGGITLTPQVIQHFAGLVVQYGHNNLMNANQQRSSILEEFKDQGKKAASVFPMPPMRYKIPEGAFQSEESPETLPSGQTVTHERLKFKGSLPGDYAASQGLGGALPPKTIPPQAAQMLKQNPATREQFDQIFGPGSAAQILGQ